MAATRQLTIQERLPELSLPDSNVDRRTCKRIVSMEVLNLSSPRTGTMSSHTAVNTFGYPWSHSVQVFYNVRDCEMWMEALDGNFFRKRGCARFTWADWDQLLGNYRAVSADPAAVALAEDLIEAYPDPKVSLVERDIEAWYATFDRKVIASVWSRFINLVANFNPFFLGPIRNVHKGWTMGWMGAHSKEEMRAKAREK